MREINVEEITKVVEKLCIESNYYLPEDVKKALEDALDKEESPLAKEILQDILKNQDIARTNNVP
ncbi:MAG: fumA, partial [Sedimentibacter sp.]|nr:fumA [Sedimentibacter sp.]